MPLRGGVNRNRFDTARFALFISRPAISGVSVSSLTATTAVITWTTDHNANSIVNYGLTGAYGSSSAVADDPPATNGVVSHSITLTGLAGSTTYHYQVVSADAYRNLSASGDFTFSTPSAGVSGMTLGSLTLWPNYNTIGVEVLFSGDTDSTASVPIQAIATTALASAGATSITLGSGLPASLPSGTRLLAHNGVIPIISADCIQGQTVLPVSSLTAAIPSGTPVWVSALLFKRSRDLQWRLGIAMSRCDNLGTDDGTQRWFSGKIVELDANTSYDVRVAVARAGTEQVLVSSVNTRVDAISSPTALLTTVTHYVDPVSGSDAGTGAIGAPWQTIGKVFSAAPSGAVVRLAPGWYPVGLTPIRSLPIALVAQFPFVTNDVLRTPESDVTHHSIIYSGFQTAPTGTAVDPNSGYVIAPWTLYTAASGNTAWKWTAPFAVIDGDAGTHRARPDLPDRIPEWSNGAATSIDGMIDIITTNQTCKFGWFQRSASTDIYMILPPWATKSSDGTTTTNPNDLWSTFGPRGGSSSGALIQVNAPNSRVCGVRFGASASGIWVGHYTAGQVLADNVVVDHNGFDLCNTGVEVRGGDPGANNPINNACTNTTIEHNLFRDTRLSDPVNPDINHTISWDAIKGSIILSTGSAFGNRLLASAESRATINHRWVRGVVIRNNTIDGTFNGAGVSGQGTNAPSATAPWHRLWASEIDVHDNLIKYCGDDGIEPEQYCSRHAYFRNRREYTYTYISLSPGFGGPVMNYDDQGWRGSPLTNPGSVAAGTHRGYKYGTQTGATGTTVWHINNTWWTDATDGTGTGRAHGGGQANGGGNPLQWRFYNSIFRVTYKPFESTGVLSTYVEDYNLWASTAPVAMTNASLDIAGTKYTTLASYRTGTSQGAHSNHFGGTDYEFLPWTTNPATTFVDGELTNAINGVLTLKTGSALRGAGIPFPNIRDQATPTTSWADTAGPALGPAVLVVGGGGGGGGGSATIFHRIASRFGNRSGSRRVVVGV